MPKYKDTALNRRLGRVGKEHGTADITTKDLKNLSSKGGNGGTPPPPKKKKDTPPPPPKTPPPKKKKIRVAPKKMTKKEIEDERKRIDIQLKKRVKKASKASIAVPPPPPPGKPPPKKSVSKPEAKADTADKRDKKPKEPKTFKNLGKSDKPLDRAKLLRKIRAGSTREKGQLERLEKLDKTKLEGGLKKEKEENKNKGVNPYLFENLPKSRQDFLMNRKGFNKARYNKESRLIFPDGYDKKKLEKAQMAMSKKPVKKKPQRPKYPPPPPPASAKKKLEFKPKDDKSEPKKNPKRTGKALGKILKKKGKYSPKESKQSKVDLFGGKTKSKINVRKLDSITEEGVKTKPKPKSKANPKKLKGGVKPFKKVKLGGKSAGQWELIGSASAEYPKYKSKTGKEPRKIRYYDRSTKKWIKEIPKDLKNLSSKGGNGGKPPTNRPTSPSYVPDEFYGKKDDRSVGDKILISVEDDGLPQDPQLLKLFPKEALTQYPTSDYPIDDFGVGKNFIEYDYKGNKIPLLHKGTEPFDRKKHDKRTMPEREYNEKYKLSKGGKNTFPDPDGLDDFIDYKGKDGKKTRPQLVKKGRKLLEQKRAKRLDTAKKLDKLAEKGYTPKAYTELFEGKKKKPPVRKVPYKQLKKEARPALIKKGRKLLQKKRDKRVEDRLKKLQNTTISSEDLDKLIDQKYEDHKAQTKQNIALVGQKSKPKPLPKASVNKKGNLRKPVGYVAVGKLPGTSKKIDSKVIASGGGAKNLTITISDKDETRLLNKRTLREGELIKGKKTIQYGEGKIIIADSIGASRENLNLPTAAQTLPKVREQVGGGMVKISNVIQPPSFGGINKKKKSIRDQDIFEIATLNLPPSGNELKYDSSGRIIEAGDWFENAMTSKGIDFKDAPDQRTIINLDSIPANIKLNMAYNAQTREATKATIGEPLLGGVFGTKRANPKDILPEGGSFRKGRKFDQARITNTNKPDPKRTGKKTKRQLLDLELGTDKALVKLVRNPNYFEGTKQKRTSQFLNPGQKVVKQIGKEKVVFKERGGGIIKKPDPPPKKAPPKPKVPVSTKTFLAGKKVKELTPAEKKEYEKVKKQNQRYGANLKKYNDFISSQPKVRSSRPYVKRAGDDVSGLSVKESLTKLGKTPKKANVVAKPKVEISERAKKAKALKKAERAGDVKTIAGRIVPRTFRDRRIKGKEKTQTIDLAVEKDPPKKYKSIFKSLQTAAQVNRLKGAEAQYDTSDWQRNLISDPAFIPRNTKQKLITIDQYENTDLGNQAFYTTTGIGDATTFISQREVNTKGLPLVGAGQSAKQAKEQLEKNAQLLTEHSDKVQRTKTYDYNKLKRANRYATKDKIEEAQEVGTIKKVGAKLAGRYAPNTPRKAEETLDDKIRDIAIAQGKKKAEKRVKGFLSGQNVGTSYKSFIRSNPKPAGPDPRFYSEGGVFTEAYENKGEDAGYAEWADYAEDD